MAAPYVPVDVVEVRIWDRQVGALMLDPASGFYAFEYSPGWVSSGVELSPLALPSGPGVSIFPQLPVNTYHRLPAFVADALPDEFGNALIDAYLARRGIAKPAITPLDRLAYLGRRAIGALEFRPMRGPRHTIPTAIEMEQIVSAAREVSMGQWAGDEESRAALMNLIQVGTSAGGQRAKAVIAWNPDTREIRSGQVPDLPEGFSHWLLKLDGVAPMAKGGAHEFGKSQGWGRVEYAYFLMAREAGVAISECQLLEEGGRAHFMTRRFDRQEGQKIHMATLCAMDHLDYRQIATHDYDQLFSVLERLGLPHASRVETFRRMVLNVMARNQDDHTKNFAFLLKEGGSWDISPAYDITYANNPQSKWVSQHLMGVNGKFKGVEGKDLLQVGRRHGLGDSEMVRVLDQVRAAVARWPEFAGHAGVDKGLQKEIGDAHLLFKSPASLPSPRRPKR